jgi:hypothetical protein
MAVDSNNDGGEMVDFVQFNARPEKGQMLRYLLASQVRKRFLERPSFKWRRQVKGAAMTGNPERIAEVYHLRNPRMFAPAMRALRGENGQTRPAFQTQIEQLVLGRDGDRDKVRELEPQRFLQMDYLREVIDQELAVKRYLLHTTIRLETSETLDASSVVKRFSLLMRKLLPVFVSQGLYLVVAGRKMTTGASTEILNIWQFQEAEEVESLMGVLSDNAAYFELNKLGTQEQHIFRNVSRHYQFSPLLNRAHPAAEAHP